MPVDAEQSGLDPNSDSSAIVKWEKGHSMTQNNETGLGRVFSEAVGAVEGVGVSNTIEIVLSCLGIAVMVFGLVLALFQWRQDPNRGREALGRVLTIAMVILQMRARVRIDGGVGGA